MSPIPASGELARISPMPRQAIRNEGAPAEAAFLEVLGNNAQPSDSAKQGDCRFLHNGQWHYIEIKHCEKDTVNQVRAIKCIPVVVFSPDRGTRRWAVLSPKAVTQMVMRKKRGQHTEIPFECATLSRNNLLHEAWCSDVGLEQRLRAALDEPVNGKLKLLMDEFLLEIKALCEKHRSRLREMLS